ncbi:MAG: hypothetical protein LQ350_006598 [Teloschistes chrysophthalmus]|nr:MAG: hypothetical protein LQ350_006598 [Niorma chrysophthalma]
MSKKKIVVCGGNGFLGSRICKSAAARSWHIVSLSRSGAPTWSSVTSSPTAPDWASAVQWEKADVLKPATYQAFLEGADAVVHSMGILLEADYKGVLTGKESLVGGLRRAFSATKGGSDRNPLERGREDGAGDGEGGGEIRSAEPDGQITYELMNRDSAITLAQESSFANVPSFVYISAAAGAPMLPKRYITTKREAESTIASSLPRLRSVFIRPGFLYDSSRSFTMPIAFAGSAGNMVNSLVGGMLTPLAGAAVEKPLKADLVAEAVVEAIADEGVKGVVGTQRIEDLANVGWRRGML